MVRPSPSWAITLDAGTSYDFDRLTFCLVLTGARDR